MSFTPEEKVDNKNQEYSVLHGNSNPLSYRYIDYAKYEFESSLYYKTLEKSKKIQSKYSEIVHSHRLRLRHFLLMWLMLVNRAITHYTPQKYGITDRTNAIRLLETLEEKGICKKNSIGRKNLYSLTNEGIDLFLNIYSEIEVVLME